MSVVIEQDYSSIPTEELAKMKHHTSRALSNVVNLVDSLQAQLDSARHDEDEWRQRNDRIAEELSKRKILINA